MPAPPSGSRTRDLVLAAEHFDRAEDERAPRGLPRSERPRSRRTVPLHGARSRSPSAAWRSPPTATTRFALLMARAPRCCSSWAARAMRIDACRAALDAAADAGERARALIAHGRGHARQRPHRRGPGRARRGRAAGRRRLGWRSSWRACITCAATSYFPLGRHRRMPARARARAAPTRARRARSRPRPRRSAGWATATTCKGRMRSAHEQFQCVRGAGARARLRSARGREPADGRLVAPSISLELGRRGRRRPTEAIELARRASQPRAELMARSLVAWVDGLMRDRRDVGAKNRSAAALRAGAAARRQALRGPEPRHPARVLGAQRRT